MRLLVFDVSIVRSRSATLHERFGIDVTVGHASRCRFIRQPLFDDDRSSTKKKRLERVLVALRTHEVWEVTQDADE